MPKRENPLRASKVRMAAASPSLPRNEKAEAQHTRTAKERLEKAKGRDRK